MPWDSCSAFFNPERNQRGVCQGSLEDGSLSDWLFGNMIWPDTPSFKVPGLIGLMAAMV